VGGVVSWASQSRSTPDFPTAMLALSVTTTWRCGGTTFVVALAAFTAGVVFVAFFALTAGTFTIVRGSRLVTTVATGRLRCGGPSSTAEAFG